MNLDEELKSEVARLRKTVIDDLEKQLRQGQLDLDKLTGANEAERWFVQHRAMLRPSVAMHFEALLRFVVAEINGLASFARASLALPESQRPSNEQFQLRVEALWNSFLREASKVLEIVERERGAMNTYNITIKDVVGPVNVLSKLEDVTQGVVSAPALATNSKETLTRLLNELKEALGSAPAQHASDAELIAEQAESVVNEFKRAEPRAAALKIKGSGLVEAASTLKTVVPAAIEIAKRIAEFVANPSA